MSANYFLGFGSNPAANSGLTPTFIYFASAAGQTLAPPGITEPISGSGVYTFTYSATLAIAFGVDGGAGLATSDRYIYKSVDPLDLVDQKIGYTTDSIGTTSTDPTTVLGYQRRALEFWEGDATVDKAAGTWSIFSRGASILLKVKNLINTITTASKS